MCCRFIRWGRLRFETQVTLENKLNAYKSELHLQNMYTIRTFIENIHLLHEECKQGGYRKLVREIKEFQTTVTQKTDELVQFHTIR